MGKHGDEYPRVPRDDYPTPAWVIDALAEHVELRGLTILEMACGKEGRMSEALKAAGCARVYSSDIVNGYAGQDEVLDFLSGRLPGLPHCDAAVTNPPFGPRGKTAEAFITRSLQLLTSGYTDFVALLLPHDFDSAKTRTHLFERCPQFIGKITLRRRVKWFEHSDLVRRKRHPKENTDWYLFKRGSQRDRRPPFILYAPGSHKG
ncbi:MAG TPA: hypothetical protein VM910_34545 [Bradyrhizobium sp.]|jgi:hypothetical protein|nr:hypothetical protein [Bradyrhizobium sp.]